MADPVYVRIERPEGYEDVCSELVIEDAIPSTAFHIADATAEVARLREALRLFVAACDTAPPVDLIRRLGAACEIARAALAEVGK